MRVVLDTNVLIASFVWRRRLTPIFDAVRGRIITPCFTDATFSELRRVLSYPKFNSQLLRNRTTPELIVRLLTSRAFVVPGIHTVVEIKDDPSDNYILACAIRAQASCIVSGDHHLLALGSYGGIPIVAPEAFIRKIRK